MKFTLNDTNGINGIERIDLREIINVFGTPNERKIERDSELKDFKVSFLYSEIDLEIFYRVNYYVGKDRAEYHSLSFIVNELYLDRGLTIKNGEDMRTILEKVEYYHKISHKDFEFEHEEDQYDGSYEFTNLNLTVYFEKDGTVGYLDDIFVDLPYEDDPEVPSLEEILYMD